MKNIFFDLDGTLIDSKPRLYYLFQHLVTESKLTFDQYWDLKRNKISHKEILTNYFKYSETDFKEFEHRWMAEIENPRWLIMDKPFDGVTDFLSKLNQYSLFIVTNRQFRFLVTEQLKNYGWENFFKKILVTEQKVEKYNLIKNTVNVTANDWFVGDTGKDIEVGKKLGIKTAAVLSGFLNKGKLMEYSPDIIINNILELEFDKKYKIDK